MSDLARHLATIDLLRATEFPARRAREAAVVSGPGYHLAELSTSAGFWEGDGSAERIAAEQRYGAEWEALSLLLSRRWGEPQVVGLCGALVRSAGGEELDEPWRGLSGGAPCLDLWQADGRWIAVGVSQQGPELPLQLVAAVTVNDPP